MRLLLDSSGPLLLCALAEAGVIVAQRRLPSGESEARDLAGIVSALLVDAGRSVGIDAIAVGIGPGSFIGTRVAISFANGLAAARGLPVFGVNSVAALLPAGGNAADSANVPNRAAIRDARRGQVYVHISGEGPEHVELVALDALTNYLNTRAVQGLVLEGLHGPVVRNAATFAQLERAAAAIGVPLEVVSGVDVATLEELASSSTQREFVEPLYLRDFL